MSGQLSGRWPHHWPCAYPDHASTGAGFSALNSFSAEAIGLDVHGDVKTVHTSRGDLKAFWYSHRHRCQPTQTRVRRGVRICWPRCGLLCHLRWRVLCRQGSTGGRRRVRSSRGIRVSDHIRLQSYRSRTGTGLHLRRCGGRRSKKTIRRSTCVTRSSCKVSLPGKVVYVKLRS